ncbi:MAG: MBL fold metallo-hydrolase [Polyangia bacterium]
MQPERLELIDLDQPREGYRRFIGCWLWRDDGLCAIVDPGPRSSVEHLLGELRRRGVASLDLVLLTHVHLDHAGGVAEVLEAFPGARAYCHPRGRPHVENPKKLWEGSQRVLGEVAAMYGRPRPVPSASLAGEEELGERGIEAIPTPGHAPHHVSFLLDGVLFAGEAFGARLPLSGGRSYLRPATPPRFFPRRALESIERLAALEPEPELTAFAHWGSVRGARETSRIAAEQIDSWLEAIRELSDAAPSELEDLVFRRLQRTDPWFGRGRFDELDEDLRARERHFFANTLEGMLGHIRAR